MSHPQSHRYFSVNAPAGGERHLALDEKGVLCLTVVDPATRKLLIPLSCVYPTQAQQRTTIPSLCQLFLNGRCRQGTQCHQVHAALDVVAALRSQVDYLPICCALHGDRDYVNALDNRSWMSRVVVHVPDATYGGGYIPLARFSYTTPISRILREVNARLESGVSVAAVDGGGHPKRMVLNACDFKICGLHTLDRCRYAEECIFLHICKEIVVDVNNGSGDYSLTSQARDGGEPGPRGAKKGSVFVSVSRQQRVRGRPLSYPTVEYQTPFPLRSYEGSMSYNAVSDINSDCSWVSGRYPTGAYMESRMDAAPLPSLAPRFVQGHPGVPRCYSSTTTSTTTTAAAREDAAMYGAGGCWDRWSSPESGCAPCAFVGSCSDCHYADNNNYSGCNGYAYGSRNGYGSDGPNCYFCPGDECSSTHLCPNGTSSSVPQPVESVSSASVSARAWQHNPYGVTPTGGISD
ncbi:hypothetical protein, conserved [Trypanosoma brucei brucei TREU927]|uniref:RNA-binding protein ZCH321 n=1 Tax=Trypanosoma brucei brucei (strain 927/4 GUTat10.1) TaxID=185431 RepID=ZC321_TRYB2|nr:hypothetical protein, conserved [Trypanosoma brucei brucei TREU927]Q57Y77.1 RecName: Full=RNA-binding protein ZCH321; AltName: Full=CCCH zinc finger protein ZC3H21 [Trypanosoma brucei brucei TREU927]AAX69418.1 hypothetical protein, conserved [Trypanosoma brucei]AAZ12331.1 hypothetical protein, conserved [Trypanosoma brucei brucei TREU927]